MADDKENTPVKTLGVGVKLRPFRFCVVCGRDVHTFRKYCSLNKDDIGDKLASVLKRDGKDVREVSNSICYNCKLKVEQVVKMKETECTIKASFATTAEASGSIGRAADKPRVKRMVKSPYKPHKKPTVKEQIFSETCSELSSQVKVLVTRSRGTEEIAVPDERKRLVIAACKRNSEEFAASIWRDSSLVLYLQNCFLQEITLQCSSIRSDVSAFGSNHKAIKEWSFLHQEKELLERAPIFSSVLKAAGHTGTAKAYETVLPGLMSAAGILLNCRNRQLNAVQTMTALQIKRGGAGSKAFDRLNHRFLSVSYKTCLRFQQQLGLNFDQKVLDWKSQIEIDNKQANGSSVESSTTIPHHPGYRLVGDNVDIMIKPRQASISNASSDLHYFNVMAVKNRISGNHLPSNKSQDQVKPVDYSLLLPSMDDHQRLLSHWGVLVGKVITKYVPALSWMKLYLPDHIRHEYSNITKKKSDVVNLGVITENENTHEGMAAIMKHLQTYVPVVDDKPVPIISGGDLLTCEREMNSKEDRQDSTDPLKVWKGLVPVIEDFHTTANFYEVIWHFLYTTSSARDHGTLFAARNFLNARSVSKEPMKDINAATELLDKYTDAMIVAAALEFFGMNTVEDEPKEHTFNMMTMDPYQYVNDTMQALIKQFALHDGPELGTPIQIKCNTCGKEYQRVATLRKHIREKHKGTMARQSEGSETDQDAIFNYSCGALSMCLVLRNFVDARKHGDGERLIMMMKFFLLYFKMAGKTKYSFHILRHLVQIKYLLPPKLAHEVIWNRFVNKQGKEDTNIEQDREMEHHNRIFKEDCRHFRGKVTTASINRVSRAAQPLDAVLKNCDKASQVVSRRSNHTEKDNSTDILKLAAQFHVNEIFKNKPPRHHHAFPSFAANPLKKLNLMDFQEWLKDKVKEIIRRDV